jgi:site-specific DNA recombinase
MAQQETNAVLYAAKSTEDKRGSIPTQLDECRAMAEREGWKIVAEFQDEGFSAYSGNRGPGLERARELAAEVKGVLVAQHSDRLARGAGDAPGAAEHLVEVLMWANRHQVVLRTVQDDFFHDPRTNVQMAAMMGQRNTEDSRRKSDAVKSGMKRRRQSGGHHGGPRPYGYRYQDDKLSPVKAEAAVVRRIFAEYLAGASQLAISRNLDVDGVKTIRGGKWHQGTVRTILANPIYIGKVRDGDELVTGVHEPIIEMKVWKKSEALRRAKTRTHATGRTPAGHHLFRKGMLRCGKCGEAMIPRTHPNRASAPTEVYHCYGRHRDKDACSMGPLPRAEIDTAVYRYFEQVGLDVETTRAAITESRDRKVAEVRALREQAERETRKAEDRLARVRRDYQDGKIEADDWAEQREQLQGERNGARAEVERLLTSEQKADAGVALADVEGETLRRLAEIRRAIAGEVNDAAGADAVRAALSRLFERFVVHRDVPERAHVELIGKIWIEPIIREQALEKGSEPVVPRLREPLEQAANNEHVALTT